MFFSRRLPGPRFSAFYVDFLQKNAIWCHFGSLESSKNGPRGYRFHSTCRFLVTRRSEGDAPGPPWDRLGVENAPGTFFYRFWVVLLIISAWIMSYSHDLLTALIVFRQQMRPNSTPEREGSTSGTVVQWCWDIFATICNFTWSKTPPWLPMGVRVNILGSLSVALKRRKNTPSKNTPTS